MDWGWGMEMTFNIGIQNSPAKNNCRGNRMNRRKPVTWVCKRALHIERHSNR